MYGRLCRNLSKKVFNHTPQSGCSQKRSRLPPCHLDRGMTIQFRCKTPYNSLKVKTLLSLRTTQLVFIYYT